MKNERIMSWIDELPGVQATEFPARRDAIAGLMNEAAELVRKADELRAQAYFAGCALEGDAKGHWSLEVVERAKRWVGR
ncbi:protein kleA [Burkholderia sp. SRS-W-2-2016]|uniref:stable inheritance protein KleA n=1 Tax=Burkholderia sp. SRS-W-2-2016 TaxID=1926878 RepID=UPI00094AFAAF|nr:stable inheritance protein KleA [Burkholderia sp. SRS-W-2-2016]OLL27287.1 protein kleA [Burkholderia sp. SRS-W-2-2016]